MFRFEKDLYLACNAGRAFSLLKNIKKYNLWTCKKVTEALVYLLANLFLFCYESDFMKLLAKEKNGMT